MTAVAVRDVIAEIAANAAALDAEPRFPTEAFEALRAAGALKPPEHSQRRVGAGPCGCQADGSVGRIFEGHLNAVERLTLDGIDPADDLLGVWGADPAPGEGEPAHIAGDELHGTKVFCSGAGGLTKALVLTKGTLVLVDLESNVEIDRTWWRAMGMRASESHRVHFHGRADRGDADAADDGALLQWRRHPHRRRVGRDRGQWRCRTRSDTSRTTS